MDYYPFVLKSVLSNFTSKSVFPGYFSELGEKANSALILPIAFLLSSMIAGRLLWLALASALSAANTMHGAVGAARVLSLGV